MFRLSQLKMGIWRGIRAVSPALEHRLRWHLSRSYPENWGYRTRLVRSSPDNAFIPRVANAGEVVGDCQVMHNGLKVALGSYYGNGSVTLLRKNRGVHEPQEERVFQEVLKTLPAGGVMIELGAYWAFYSLWFCKEIVDARAILVEPLAENLAYGERNFAINGYRGQFLQAFVGRRSGVAQDGTAVLAVDDLVVRQNVDRVAVLHSDIQGFELEMLRGAATSLTDYRIGWCFISTHSEDLHHDCLVFLEQRGYRVVASIPPSESYSVDGILVAHAPQATPIAPLNLSRRKRG